MRVFTSGQLVRSAHAEYSLSLLRFSQMPRRFRCCNVVRPSRDSSVQHLIAVCLLSDACVTLPFFPACLPRIFGLMWASSRFVSRQKQGIGNVSCQMILWNEHVSCERLVLHALVELLQGPTQSRMGKPKEEVDSASHFFVGFVVFSFTFDGLSNVSTCCWCCLAP